MTAMKKNLKRLWDREWGRDSVLHKIVLESVSEDFIFEQWAMQTFIRHLGESTY